MFTDMFGPKHQQITKDKSQGTDWLIYDAKLIKRLVKLTVGKVL